MPIQNQYKYDNSNNVGKLFLRKLLEKYNADSFVGTQKLGFNVNTTELWNSYAKKKGCYLSWNF